MHEGQLMRVFGLEEANRLVPFLLETFEAAQPVVNRLRLLIEALERNGPRSEVVEERDELTRKLGRLLAPVEELGVDVKGADGLVDFRAVREGRLVYLCWRFPEGRVCHWHELGAGYAGRRRIRADGEFAASYLC